MSSNHSQNAPTQYPFKNCQRFEKNKTRVIKKREKEKKTEADPWGRNGDPVSKVLILSGKKVKILINNRF